MKRPLVAVVVAYGTGLLLAYLFHPSVPILGGLLALFAVFAIAFWRFHRRLAYWAFWVWLLVAWVGAANFILHNIPLSAVDLRTLLPNEAALVSVQGTLVRTPQLKVVEHGESDQWRSVARVRICGIRREGKIEKASGEIITLTPGELGSAFVAGQKVEVSGVIQQPALPIAPGLFNPRSYWAAQGIYYQLKAGSTNDWTAMEPRLTKVPLTDTFLSWAKATLALGLPVEDETVHLIWSIVDSTTGTMVEWCRYEACIFILSVVNRPSIIPR